MSSKSPEYFEDLAVGDRFSSIEHQLDTGQIVEFARQFDPQPFHTDPEAAAESFFGGLVASGWHTAAITMKLIVDALPLADGVIGTGGHIERPNPARPGDTLHVECTVQEVRQSRSKPDRGLVKVECRTLNQSDELCMRYVTTLVVTRRPEGGADALQV
ncbi:MaoC family dehydratase [Brevibacterium daeguense]|uniref:MaoC family dehydratase n=1 Tax=Brevibacterium daeguense TaxID=909936 RepID=A0ABP8EHL2_9MICO|nr:MaoC family dehydratase [Brevibacterium daeguense]